MTEQPKLLRRPLPRKVPSKLSTSREKVGKAGRGFGQYRARAVKSTNDKNGKAVPDSCASTQGQVKQTDVSFSHGHVSQNPVKTQPKDTFLSVHQGQTQIQPKDLLQSLYQSGSVHPQSDHISSCPVHFQHRHVCQFNQDSKYGQTQVQSKKTGFYDQRRGLKTTFPSEDVKQKGDLVFKNNNSAHWSLRGNAASLVDQYEIICSCSQIPNQSKEKNVISSKIPRRDFILTTSPSGPDYFSFCKNHKCSYMKRQKLQSAGPVHSTPPVFTLESLAAGSSHHLPLKTTLKKPIVSRYNCEVLSKRLMTENRSLQTKVNTVILADIALPADETRKPEQQKFLEMASQEKTRKSDTPEEVLQEQKTEKAYIIHYVKLTDPDREEGPLSDANDAPDSSSVEGDWETRFHFMANRKDEEEKLIYRSQVKVWHCFLNRKTDLSLQAYFLFHLPDLTPLMDTLVRLNLSFNNLLFFPTELFNIKSLQVLVLRSNPIRKIPNDIHKLKSLKKLTISFNLLSELPSGLFLLEDLWYLDIAYNYISSIPNDIKNVRKLEYLNAEGNQLSALPSGVLSLPLKFLGIENNFIHPLLWNEEIQNQPQKLIHLAALCFSTNNLKERYDNITEDIKKILDDFTVCDCCSGPRYGEGLQLVQMYRNNVFKFGRLPFHFYACSSSCHRNFASQPEV
ncbi:leucine-rich repeat-containing protein 63 isoform X1 [Coturnix japonica]|uniref:leucine-rich repeat-containing protein 63 isoform X1 n=1 Tax=Coturnix japonica TaxID=93934 RepID=UPI00077813E8|nr:leucine-rich repeat-containing protein 63 isoform X1 [Coturnix japonica]